MIAQLNDAELFYEVAGAGPPLVCVHGSWDDHHSWDTVAARLRDRFTVLVYDRRGHSASTAPPGQGRIGEDVDDVAALVEHLGMAPAHVVGHSYGASVAILVAVSRPGVVSSLVAHEPPLFALLANDDQLRPLAERAGELMRRAAELLEAGKVEGGTRLFVDEVAFGPGSWRGLLTEDARRTMVANAGTWLDQFRDRDRLAVDVTPLAAFPGRITLTTGSDSLPAYPAVVTKIGHLLPSAQVVTIEGAGHGAPLSHPAEFAAVVAAGAGGQDRTVPPSIRNL
jgi:pimeloyl-ACP methyl ester carboxylesterase